MTVKIDLALESIFKTNSLRNLTTIGNNPMPHKGDTYYLWVDSYETELGKYLTENNKWVILQPHENQLIAILI